MQSCLFSLSEGMEFLPLVCECEVWTRQERLFRHSRPLDRKSRKVAVLIAETTAARWFSCDASSTATELLPQLHRGVLHQLQPLNLLPNFPNCFFNQQHDQSFAQLTRTLTGHDCQTLCVVLFHTALLYLFDSGIYSDMRYASKTATI